MNLVCWHAKLKNWHAFVSLARWDDYWHVDTLARTNPKLTRFWHVFTLANGHVDDAEMHGTHGSQFSKLFLLQPTEGTGRSPDYAFYLKLLSPKQMLQRLTIALTQVKAGNISENLINKIQQNIYYFYRPKEITKKVHKNITNSIKV